MYDLFAKLTSVVGNAKVFKEEPLSKYTTFHLGGSARYFVRVVTIEDFVKVYELLQKENTPFFILGGGTNTLVGDNGFDGVVIKNETSKIKFAGMKVEIKKEKKSPTISKVYIEAESGVGINRLVRFTLDQKLSGLEAFLGQPGSVGGAVYMNAHNMNQNKFFGDSLIRAKILNKEGEIVEVTHEYFRFGYDKSKIQTTKEVLLSATFELQRDESGKIWEKAQQALEHRKSTQPQGYFSAGCTFQNIKKSDSMRISTPGYTCSAGYLLDKVGMKGKKIGGAEISTYHANFIVHKGGARASDVLQLISLAKKKVFEKFHIRLIEEIVLMGDF